VIDKLCYRKVGRIEDVTVYVQPSLAGWRWRGDGAGYQSRRPGGGYAERTYAENAIRAAQHARHSPKQAEDAADVTGTIEAEL
jgi:hypothetical protein